MKLDNVRQILVLNRNHIGDCLLTTPLLRALKRRYPRARLCVSVPESNRELLKTNSHVDRIVIQPINSWASKFKFAWEIHTRGYDLIISLQEKSNFYAWATHFSAVLNRRLISVGLDHPRTRRHYQHNVPVQPGRHEVFKYLDVAELLGCPPEKNPVLELTPPPGSREKIGAWASIEGFDPDQRFVGINPGGTKPEKRWLLERFAEVADRLHEETGLPALITWRSDRPGQRPGDRGCGGHAHPTDRGRAGLLGDTAALLERCNLLVTGDTGPMHMAVALALPVVALFGPTDPAKFRPFSSASVVLRHEKPCASCAAGPATKSNPRPSRWPCIHTITAADVTAAALSLYQGPMTRVPPRRFDDGFAPASSRSIGEGSCSTPHRRPAGWLSRRRRMRIAVVNSLRVSGGGEKWAVRLAPCWQERGHQVRILCQPGSGLEKLARAAGLDTAPTVMRHDLSLPGVFAIAGQLRRFRPDLVLCCNERAYRLTVPASLMAGHRPLRLPQRP